MEGLLFGGIVIVIVLSVMLFYYICPYVMKSFIAVPEWVLAIVYSFACTSLAATSYDFSDGLIVFALIFSVGLAMIALISLIKRINPAWVKLLLGCMFIVFTVITSIIVLPIFWPISLVILLLYLLAVFCGWYFIVWLRLNGY